MGARDVVFTILAIDEASRTFRKVGAEAEGLGAKLGPLGKLGGMALATIGVAAAAAAVEGVKLASSFQSSMAQLATQAHVPKAEVDSLSQSVLNLAGKVGEGPDSLAEALYHIESSFASVGIKGPEAMHLLQTAAEGAKIGHADLVDVTNALDAAVASGIPGVKNFDQAMGMLNATVGAGDMKMQDLADAFSTGLPAVAKAYGVSLREVGGALAVFGDLNIRGQNAATDLRVAIMDMTKQAKPGQAALKSIGITAGELGQDMQKGGLNKALTDLHDHLDKAGLKGASMGRFLEDAFTKKSSAPMAILLGNFDRFQGKLKEVDKGAHEFGESWKTAQATFAQQWDQFKASVEASLTKLGLKLLPMLTTAMPEATKIAGAAIDGLSASFDAIGDMVKKAKDWLDKTFGDKKTAKDVTQLKDDISKAFKEIWTAVGPVLANIKDVIEKDVLPSFKAFLRAMVPVVDWFVKEMGPKIKSTMQNIGTIIGGALKVLSGIFDVFTGLLTGNWGKLWDGLKKIAFGAGTMLLGIVKQMWTAIIALWDVAHAGLDKATQMLWNGIKKVFSGAKDMLVDAGKAIVEGLINGVKSMAGSAVDTVKNLGSSLVGGLAGAVGWNSPAKKFIPIGRGIIEGVTEGLKAEAPNTYAMMKSFALKIADIKVSPTLRDSVHRLADHFGADLVLTTNQISGLTTKIKAQQQKVADLIKAKADYASQLASGLTGGGTIAGIQLAQDTTDENGNVTKADKVGGFIAALQAKADAITKFGTNIAALRAKGLSQSILQQIEQSGLETGGALAAALSTATPAAIQQIDALSKNVQDRSDLFGKRWAGQMYDTGIAAGEGVVKGLTSQISALLATVRKMAEQVVAEIKRSLKIKSPSGVMADEVGAMIPAGIAAGMTANAHLVTSAARTLIPTAAGAYGAGAGRSGQANAGGDTHVHLHVGSGFIGSADDLARALSDVMRRAKGRGSALTFA